MLYPKLLTSGYSIIARISLIQWVYVPETMEEVREILPQLTRNELNCHVSNFTGINYLQRLLLLYTRTEALFGKDITDIKLDSEEALNGMIMLTENYTIYNMPMRQSFYQSFRDGTIPLGIGIIACSIY